MADDISNAIVARLVQNLRRVGFTSSVAVEGEFVTLSIQRMKRTKRVY